MCAACGIADHIPTIALTPPPAARPGGAKFAALRHPDCRFYVVGTMLSMMADNIEHVISYWVLYQKFHSPALAGFAVISHWVPSLVFSVYFGGLSSLFIGAALGPQMPELAEGLGISEAGLVYGALLVYTARASARTAQTSAPSLHSAS